MTDRDTIRLIKDYYGAFNRGDWSAMLACVADDVVHDLNQGASEHGSRIASRRQIRDSAGDL